LVDFHSTYIIYLLDAFDKGKFYIAIYGSKKEYYMDCHFCSHRSFLTYLLPIIIILIAAVIFRYYTGSAFNKGEFYNMKDEFYNMVIIQTVTLVSITEYVNVYQIQDLSYVFVPSTLLTSIWVIFFLLSSIITSIFTPLEYLRRFTIWGFKDVDRHPLKAIAKVAAALIVGGAFVLKAARWGWLMV
jgi:hypothetical protein